MMTWVRSGRREKLIGDQKSPKWTGQEWILPYLYST
jgi:hypothetical protein